MINLTLFAQILAFLFAWYVMQRYLWPHAISAYDEEHGGMTNLKTSVTFAQDQVAIQEAMTVGEWQTIARACRKAAKVPEIDLGPLRLAQEPLPEINRQELQNVADKLADTLIKQVPHA